MPEERNEEETEMSLSEKLQYEEYLVNEAFNNSFLVITKRDNFENLLASASTKERAIMAHNPTEEPDVETLENMMYYFEDLEEYEKCAEIKKILDVHLQS
tara:strand:- start:158 stop:457 length:300 start_codon:yes stop_codon:yes gene_type:complete